MEDKKTGLRNEGRKKLPYRWKFPQTISVRKQWPGGEGSPLVRSEGAGEGSVHASPHARGPALLDVFGAARRFSVGSSLQEQKLAWGTWNNRYK